MSVKLAIENASDDEGAGGDAPRPPPTPEQEMHAVYFQHKPQEKCHAAADLEDPSELF